MADAYRVPIDDRVTVVKHPSYKTTYDVSTVEVSGRMWACLHLAYFGLSELILCCCESWVVCVSVSGVQTGWCVPRYQVTSEACRCATGLAKNE